MEEKWSMVPKCFSGVLSKDGDQVKVDFTAALDASGELTISFSRIPLNEKSVFIPKHFYEQSTQFAKFVLTGTALDRTTFKCENVIFSSLGNLIEEGSASISPQARYSSAILTMIGNSSDRPALIWRLKGFESIRPLRLICPLGLVEMVGEIDASGKNKLSGFIRITTEDMPPRIEEWRSTVNTLCVHLRHVMSFAASVNLAAPLSEFYHNGIVEIEAYSQGTQEQSDTPVFPKFQLDEIFKSAVHSHFCQAFKVNNLNFAIQWFTMRGTYREAKLISSMTVLENLIDSNLTEEDTLILSKNQFERLRKKLSTVVKEQAVVWSNDPGEQQAFIREFNNRFLDLKRRSLFGKIKLLATRWGVKLDDIAELDIREAKSARDQVVHRGHYEPRLGTEKDLYAHVLLIRELVVRFILTALQFNGSYVSYIGGYHMRKFERNPIQLNYKK